MQAQTIPLVPTSTMPRALAIVGTDSPVTSDKATVAVMPKTALARSI